MRLRLPRHLYDGNKKYLSLYLSDTPDHRELARTLAQRLEADIQAHCFDFSLERYRFSGDNSSVLDSLSLLQLWHNYSSVRMPHLEPSSRKLLSAITHKLERCPYSSVEDAAHIKRWLLTHFSFDSSRRTLQQLKACCNWAIEQSLLVSNPFAALKPLPKVAHQQIDPFTPSERDAIIAAFERNRFYCYYAGFVQFLFFTGCRPSEAIALRWEAIDPAMTHIVFCSAFVEGNPKSTKNRKIRSFPINPQLLVLLQSLEREQPERLVFPSPKGHHINLHNFGCRAWKAVVSSLPFRFRTTYSCRHTFITECLRAGIPVQQVAEWVGNSASVLLDHYAGLTGESVPEF